jgi:hypothetical protein
MSEERIAVMSLTARILLTPGEEVWRERDEGRRRQNPDWRFRAMPVFV